MTRNNNELDEYGKRLFKTLRQALNLDSADSIVERTKFLELGEKYRREKAAHPNGAQQQARRRNKSGVFGFLAMPVLKPLLAIFVAVIVLAGSSFSVYASRESLPGEPLYLIKSWSEDIRLSLTRSPQARLQLTLDYTERRVGEITRLVEAGKTLPDQTSVRYQGELENALVLAAGMDDNQIHNALGLIRRQAESQGITLEELIQRMPEQAEPAIIRLRQMLQEQIRLSDIGSQDPKGFRNEIRERARHHGNPSWTTPDVNNSSISGTQESSNPDGSDSGGNHGTNSGKPSEAPGHGGENPSQGQSTPDNGNHGPDPKETPKP